MWVNQKGDAEDFTAISISYVHNMLEQNASRKFTPQVNSTRSESQSYTSLMWTGERSGVLTYDAGRGTKFASAYSVRFALQ